MTATRGWIVALIVAAVCGCSGNKPTTPPVSRLAKPPQEKPAGAEVAMVAQPAPDEAAAAEAPDEGGPPDKPEPAPVQEAGERILMFTKGGPVVIEVFVTIDGQPYLTAQGRLVDELLKMADSSGDGMPTWDELIAHPQFSRFATPNPGETAPTAEQQKKNFDRDNDGQVSRGEAERFLTQVARPQMSLALEGSMSQYRSKIVELLDLNGDRYLSADEWPAAEQELLLRDLDGNEVLDAFEVAGTTPMPGQPAEAMRPRYSDDGVPRAMLLGARDNWGPVLYWLEELYLHEGVLCPESFPLAPTLFGQLDLDGDARLSKEELERFKVIPAHVELEVHFGRTDQARGPRVRGISPELRDVQAVDGLAAVEIGGLRLELLADDLLPSQDFEAQARTTLERLDADQNGYLEEAEVDDQEEALPAGTFKSWDTDEDGKVYAAELAAYLKSQQAPAVSRIRATVGDADDPYFVALDTDSDGRLSLREMRSAAARLSLLDANADGRLTSGEIPTVVTLAVDRGDGNPPMMRRARRVRSADGTPDGEAPRWFSGMDRNADRDLSPAEFLGTPEQFARLDLNSDGFIDPSEAHSASAGP
jgi:Ca2+-binding EF-hand superfamily protein